MVVSTFFSFLFNEEAGPQRSRARASERSLTGLFSPVSSSRTRPRVKWSLAPWLLLDSAVNRRGSAAAGREEPPSVASWCLILAVMASSPSPTRSSATIARFQDFSHPEHRFPCLQASARYFRHERPASPGASRTFCAPPVASSRIVGFRKKKREAKTRYTDRGRSAMLLAGGGKTCPTASRQEHGRRPHAMPTSTSSTLLSTRAQSR